MACLGKVCCRDKSVLKGDIVYVYGVGWIPRLESSVRGWDLASGGFSSLCKVLGSFPVPKRKWQEARRAPAVALSPGVEAPCSPALPDLNPSNPCASRSSSHCLLCFWALLRSSQGVQPQASLSGRGPAPPTLALGSPSAHHTTSRSRLCTRIRGEYSSTRLRMG